MWRAIVGMSVSIVREYVVTMIMDTYIYIYRCVPSRRIPTRRIPTRRIPTGRMPTPRI